MSIALTLLAACAGFLVGAEVSSRYHRRHRLADGRLIGELRDRMAAAETAREVARGERATLWQLLEGERARVAHLTATVVKMKRVGFGPPESAPVPTAPAAPQAPIVPAEIEHAVRERVEAVGGNGEDEKRLLDEALRQLGGRQDRASVHAVARMVLEDGDTDEF